MPRWHSQNEDIEWIRDGRGVMRGVVRGGYRGKAEPEILHPALCQGCHKQFDLSLVEITARYEDCSMWRCPHCGIIHDDRQKWGAAPEYRMGYIDLKRQTEEYRKRMEQT